MTHSIKWSFVLMSLFNRQGVWVVCEESLHKQCDKFFLEIITIVCLPIQCL